MAVTGLSAGTQCVFCGVGAEFLYTNSLNFILNISCLNLFLASVLNEIMEIFQNLNETGVMLYCVMLCYVMLCYVVLCCIMLCCVVLCCVMLCFVILFYVVLCCVILYYVVLCYVMLCCVMLYYVVLCYVMFYYVVLCCVMLCCVMLCCVMLCCVMLCYVLLCCVKAAQYSGDRNCSVGIVTSLRVGRSVKRSSIFAGHQIDFLFTDC